MNKKELEAFAREAAKGFGGMYNADIPPTLISKVTDAVLEQVVEWQSRPLNPVYPIADLDYILIQI